MKALITDEDIARALICQVARCADGDPETRVTTHVTRPMWAAFCRFVGESPNSEPTPWIGLQKTRRIYGSETHVVESPHMWAICTKAAPARVEGERGGG